MKRVEIPYILVRWVLGIVFIYAGGTKLADPRVFGVLIEAYGIVPDALILPVAILLPALEVIAGVGLMRDVYGSLAVITGLIFLFLLILGYGIHMGLDVDCGCFGPEDPEARAFHGLRQAFFRDLVMLVGAAFIYAWRRVWKICPRPLFLPAVQRVREKPIFCPDKD